MQGQQPVIRQADSQILQQPTSIVIKMTDGIQQITPVGKCIIKKNKSANFHVISPHLICQKKRERNKIPYTEM